MICIGDKSYILTNIVNRYSWGKQKDGVGVVKVDDNGKISYMSKSRAVSQLSTTKDVVRLEHQGFDYKIDLDLLKDSLFQTITIGKLISKLFFVYNIPDYDKTYSYYTFYENIKDRENNILKNELDRTKPYYQQVIPKYVQEELVNEYYAYFNDKLNGEIKIVEGEYIRKYYWRKYYWRKEPVDIDWDNDNYIYNQSSPSTYDEGLTGSLAGSCMRYGGCQGFFDIYVQNPNQIKMAVYLKDDLVCARAILWYNGESKFYDKIYSIDSLKEYQLKNWLESNGFITVNNSELTTIKLDKVYFDYYPYLDNLKYCYVGDKTISIIEHYGEYYYTLTHYDGGYDFSDEEEEDDEDTVWCEISGDRLHIEEAVYLEYRGWYVADRYATTDSRGENRLIEDCRWSETMDIYVYEDNAIYVKDLEDYIDEDNIDEYDVVYSNYHSGCYSLESVTYHEDTNDYYLNNVYEEKFNSEQESTETNISDSELQLQLF
jgi:hypothetical protein